MEVMKDKYWEIEPERKRCWWSNLQFPSQSFWFLHASLSQPCGCEQRCLPGPAGWLWVSGRLSGLHVLQQGQTWSLSGWPQHSPPPHLHGFSVDTIFIIYHTISSRTCLYLISLMVSIAEKVFKCITFISIPLHLTFHISGGKMLL